MGNLYTMGRAAEAVIEFPDGMKISFLSPTVELITNIEENDFTEITCTLLCSEVRVEKSPINIESVPNGEEAPRVELLRLIRGD